ncbi:MAG: AI-2E family transporter [Actinomycetota bacterium]|nr:AI-2E family transporter [Actinomycetota bacterium]
MEESRISSRTVYLGIVLFVTLLVGLYFIYQVSTIVLAFLLTMLFSVVLDGPVGYLAQRGLPRTLGVLLIIVVLTGMLWLFGLFLAPTVGAQARQFVDDFPTLLEETGGLIERFQNFFGLDLPIEPNPDGLLDAARDFLTEGRVWEAAAGVGMTVATVASLALVVLLAAVYLVARPEPWTDGFVSLFPAERRQRVREVLEKLHRTVQRWILGQLVAMTFIGISSAIALHFIGIPFALLLGIFAALIAFIPYLGAIVGGIPPVLLALVSDPILAVWVILVYTVIQMFEGYVIQPLVMSQAVRLHPTLVLFAILVMGTLFGIIGVLLAVPLVAALQVLVNEVWVKRMDRKGEDPNPSRPRAGEKPDLLDPLRRVLKILRS